ncbi:MAG: glycosyltransferase [Blastocatellia bacterium]|nr:glycosyltransferase [Blastocatellia bacterium]
MGRQSLGTRQAKRAAKGDWIVATDADIVFAPEAVRAAMSVAFRGRFDAVTLLPDIGAGTFGTRVVMPIAAWMIAIVLPIDKTNDPKSEIALGCGGFFLMRRRAHDAVGGYEAIRGEVIDDVATARALKSGGRRLRIEAGQQLLFTPMYETLGELWHGFSKNAFAGAGNSVATVARNVTANLLATVLPITLAVAGLVLWLVFGVAEAMPVALAAVAAYAAMVVAFLPVYGALGGRWYLAPLAGFANVVMVAILMNSAWRALSGKGVVWRGQRTQLVTDRRS